MVGEIFTAHVYNGSVGYFDYVEEKRAQVAQKLLAEGFTMRSRVPSADGKRVALEDNSRVHISDIMCQLVSKNILEGDRADIAMEKGFCEIPAEIIGLMLSVSEPDSIVFARINMPMHIGTASHGTYLATAPQAFPDDASEPFLLPPFSRGMIKKDSLSVSPFKKAPATIAPLSARVLHDCYSAVCAALKERKHKVSELTKIVTPLFDKADCVPATSAVYITLYELHRKGVLKIERSSRPGVFEGLSAPIFYLSI